MVSRWASRWVCGCSLAVLAIPGAAWANGNETQALSFSDVGTGVGLVSTGVGLAGRREVGADVPGTSANLILAGIPAGATVKKAFLYWVTYGLADSSVTLKGTAVTGQLIGTSAQTCWSETWGTGSNYAYRADVTALVTGNDTYAIGGYPSAAANGDSQGASLVVVYHDPASSTSGEVYVYDGAATVGMEQDVTFSMQAPHVGAATKALLHIGAGDGQSNKPDAPLSLSGKELPYPPGTHDGVFDGISGSFWDDLVLDVKPHITLDGKDIPVVYSFANDCLVMAYHALDITSQIVDEDGDGVHDPVDNCPGVKNADQANHDADKLGDACDNCPVDANFNQQDFDADGAGDVCDTCKDDYNPDQADYDHDKWGDVCDDCPCIANNDQTDSNLDGVGNACDPAFGGDATMCDLSTPSGEAGAGGIPSTDGGAPPTSGGTATGEAGDSSVAGASANGGKATTGGKTSTSGKSSSAGGDEESEPSGGEGGAASEGRAVARDDGGCGCQVPGSAPTSSAFGVVAAALAWFARRRRERSRVA